MSTDTATQHAPDLSALTPTERLNIAVALTQPGVEWFIGGSVCYLFAPTTAWATIRESGTGAYAGPNYAGDPAAWGELMEKEGVWAQVSNIDDKGNPCEWEGVYRLEGGTFDVGTPGVFPNPGQAICASVLQKHGVKWERT